MNVVRTALAVMLLVVGCRASAAAKYFNPNIGFKQALSQGDRAALKKAWQQKKDAGARRVGRLAILKSQMRLETVIHDGKVCFNDKALRQRQPVIAIVCVRFAASAAFADQRVAEAAHIIRDGEAFARPVVARHYHRQDVRVGYFAAFSAKKFLTVPPIVVRGAKSVSFVPWDASCSNRGRVGGIKIDVNGKKHCFLVSSAHVSIVNPKTARALGLHVYRGDYGKTSEAALGGASSISLAVAKKVKIGKTSFGNFPFSVVKGDLDTIGTDALHRFARVSFGKKGIAINGAGAAACHSPMAFAVSGTYFGALTLQAWVNGTRQRVAFANTQKTALVSDLDSFAPKRDLSSPIRIHAASGRVEGVRTHANLSASSGHSSNFNAIYAPKLSYSAPVIAGHGILRLYKVVLDFDKHKACLEPSR